MAEQRHVRSGILGAAARTRGSMPGVRRTSNRERVSIDSRLPDAGARVARKRLRCCPGGVEESCE